MNDEVPLANVPDLSSSLTRIHRRTQEARARCANNLHTRAFVAAGMSLIDKQFKLPCGDNLDPAEPDRRDLLRFLSQQEVVDEANRLFEGQMIVTKAMLRDRWEYQSHYVADLSSYLISTHHWSLRVAYDEAGPLLASADSLSAAIHEVAFLDLLDSRENSHLFQLVATATAERDPIIKEALTSLYRRISDAWRAVYQSALTDRGLRLRPGITVEMLTTILSATAEGLAQRIVADADADVLDTESRTSLLGTTAIALANALIDYEGEGLSIEEILDNHAHT